MKTIDIKGKKYVTVNERIKYFRTDKKYEGWALVSDIISHQNGSIIIQAKIFDNTNDIVSTGLAMEKEGDGYINKTSYIENCETSAWGRALGNLGIGIDTSIASADEVQNSIENAKVKRVLVIGSKHWDNAIAKKMPLEKVKEHYSVDEETEDEYLRNL